MKKMLGRSIFWATIVACAPLVGAVDLSTSIAGSVSDSSYTMPYRLFQPQGVDPNQKVPLVLFLHGMGDRGTDNIAQTTRLGGLLNATQSGAYSSYVLAPQIGTDQWFQSYDGKETQAMSLTIQAVKDVMATKNIDPSRVYVTGLSMGGMGTWDALYWEPKMFAAAVPMSGGAVLSTIPTIKDVPVWAFHGGADSVVPVQQTRDTINALIEAGGSPKYTEIPGADHDIWGPIYDDASHTLYPWLFSQHLSSDTAVPVNPPEILASSSDPVTVDLSTSPVPEPGSLSVLAIAAAGLLLRRRRAA